MTNSNQATNTISKAEAQSARLHQVALEIDLPGYEDATVYFNVDGDGEGGWTVADHLDVYHEGVCITSLVSPDNVIDAIHKKHKKVSELLVSDDDAAFLMTAAKYYEE